MPLLWELLKTEAERETLRSLIKRKNWKPPSSDGHISIESAEELAKLMKETPKGKQGVLTGGAK